MGEGTFAGTRGNDENAPVPDIRPCCGKRVKPTPKQTFSAHGARRQRGARKDGTGIPAEVASEDPEQDRPYVRHCLPVPGDFTQQLDLFEKIALACNHGA
jgi:hypothetical protein